MMEALSVFAISLSLTLFAVLTGWKLAMLRKRIDDIKFFESLDLGNFETETPIGDKLGKKYNA